MIFFPFKDLEFDIKIILSTILLIAVNFIFFFEFKGNFSIKLRAIFVLTNPKDKVLNLILLFFFSIINNLDAKIKANFEIE